MSTERLPNERQILEEVMHDLTKECAEGVDFRLITMIADELAAIEDAQVPRYLYHRYRYPSTPSFLLLFLLSYI